MKAPKLSVMPKNQTKKEKRMAEIMEKIINYHYKEHQEFLDKLVATRASIEAVHGIKTNDMHWDVILTAYINKVFELVGQQVG